MAPKPFPYPLGIGIDVCKVARIARVLRSTGLRNQWARRVFTRLEWPDVCRYFEKTRISMTDDAGNTRVIGREANAYHPSGWMLPPIPTRWLHDVDNVPLSKTALDERLSDDRTPVVLLARYLAGRYGISISPGLYRSSDDSLMSGGLRKRL